MTTSTPFSPTALADQPYEALRNAVVAAVLGQGEDPRHFMIPEEMVELLEACWFTDADDGGANAGAELEAVEARLARIHEDWCCVMNHRDGEGEIDPALDEAYRMAEHKANGGHGVAGVSQANAKWLERRAEAFAAAGVLCNLGFEVSDWEAGFDRLVEAAEADDETLLGEGVCVDERHEDLPIRDVMAVVERDATSLIPILHSAFLYGRTER